MMQKRIVCLAVAFLVCGNACAGEPAWKYVADATAEAPIRPVFRFVAVSSAKPDELREEISYRGKEQKYAQIRYGSDDSRTIVVVVDEVSRDDFDLYVDADRNRVIESKEKIAGAGKDRAGPLDLEITRGMQIVHERRKVQWRLGAARATIGLATSGYVEGTLQIGGKKHSVRRVDGNANGFFADAADRLWIDLNNDNQWDAIDEQFPYSPILTLNNQRYGIRGDALGLRLAIEPLSAEGRIRLRLGELAKDVRVQKLDVMLTGDDGSAFAINALDAATVLPAGRYAIGSVALSLEHSGANQPTHFVFFRVGIDDETRWHELKKDQELTIDPVGKLRFSLEIDASHRVRKPGESIRIQPQLFTADGLIINVCSVGDADDVLRNGNHKQCSVKLSDAKNQVIEERSTGFACGTFCPVSVQVPRDARGKLGISGDFDPGPLGPPVRANEIVEVRP
jgi:hypothetical protein